MGGGVIDRGIKFNYLVYVEDIFWSTFLLTWTKAELITRALRALTSLGKIHSFFVVGCYENLKICLE